MTVVRMPLGRLSAFERSVVAIGEHMTAWGRARAERRHISHEQAAHMRARDDADATRRAQVWLGMLP